MKHLRNFDSVSAMEAAITASEITIVGLAFDGSTPVLGRKSVTTPPDPKTIPFYIDVRGPVTLAATSGLQMSTDGETWTDTTATTLSSGKTYFRVASDQSSPLNPNWTEDSNSDYDIGGNINSLVKTNFENDTTCYSFYISNAGFFQNKAQLKSAGNLILPATTLVGSCYSNMFNGCTSLTTAPELPAATLAGSCYNDMFNGCTSLTTAPELPATILISYCYNQMFFGCTSLTTAPELPATRLAQGCYSSMFDRCSNLNYIKCLATNISSANCLYYWVNRVSSTGTFVKDPNMSSWPTGKNGIPSGWTVEDATA